MRIFLSYASEQTGIAESVAVALEGEGHDVFRDRSDLPAGDAYHDRIRDGVATSDLFVFLVSPESVAQGRYTITELEFAQARWANPSDRVLPVVVRPTDLRLLPAYLKGVTLLEPRGNVPASVAATVARLARPPGRRRLRLIALLVVLVVIVGGGFAVRAVMQRRALAREVTTRLDAARLELGTRNYPAAWEWTERATALDPDSGEARATAERVAMDWLENIRVTTGKTTFTDIISNVQPVLTRCATGTALPRTADCRAHLGWADFLRARDGAGGVDPVQHYRRAIGLDPQNVYGHAMWGFEMLRTRGSMAEARAHFDAALASGRERGYVRSLQLAGAFWTRDASAENEAIRVANEMRIAGETLQGDAPASAGFDVGRFWTIYFGRIFADYDVPSFLAAVSPADHVATFQWLFPNPDPDATRHDLKRFVLAKLLENAGRRDDALAMFTALRDDLARTGGFRTGGRLPDQTLAAVKRLSGK